MPKLKIPFRVGKVKEDRNFQAVEQYAAVLEARLADIESRLKALEQ